MSDEIHLPALISEMFDVPRSQARRLLAQGAVRIDDEVLDPSHMDVLATRLDGRALQVARDRKIVSLDHPSGGGS